MNFGSALEQVHRRAPLVDCITNFVTVNDCANILLAVGGSPTGSRTAAARTSLSCARASSAARPPATSSLKPAANWAASL